MGRTWDKEEENFLFENVGILKVETIAKKLNRSIDGVILKMNRLNIANTKEQLGLLTMGELSRLLGVDRKTVENWYENHKLYFSKRKTRNTKTYYFISPLDFWKWAYENQDRIDFSKIEPNAIPPEPDWVDSLRVEKRPKGNYYVSWTTKEEGLLIELRENGETYKSIAKYLNRTPISVERKYKRLTAEIKTS